jgi:hypothetical protein
VGILYPASGTWDVTLKVSNSLTTTTLTRKQYIHSGPAPVISLGPDTAICAGNSLVLDAGNPGCSYLWSTGDTTQTLAVDSAGTGFGTRTYGVDAWNSLGCVGSDSIRVSFILCDGVNEPAGIALSLRPNPVKDLLHIDYRIDAEGTYFLFNAEGVLCKTGILDESGKTMSLDLSDLPTGLYILNLRAGSRAVSERIVKY